MAEDTLWPSLDLVKEEYVLVQAWKKTASYIRSHNWYADTLALDRAAVDLPEFLAGIRRRLEDPLSWQNSPLRVVPAPKSQRWIVDPKSGRWGPVKKNETARKLRPLAHVDLADQVLATTLLLCLADRAETEQGNPEHPISGLEARRAVVSYGNRLYCDSGELRLKHRWGSGKLYRSFFSDYRRFLARPEIVAEHVGGKRVVVVQSDLRQFYDRVSPETLAHAIGALRHDSDDSGFFDLAARLFSWSWHTHDKRYVDRYSASVGLADFSRVALPQGLVASGFMANVALLGFDHELREAIGTELWDGCILHDVCRYVDDIRLVLTAECDKDIEATKARAIAWLSDVLARTSPDLELSPEKTTAAAFRGGDRPLARHSAKMQRIQQAVSGGFDAVGGLEILNAIQGLLSSQTRFAPGRLENDGWSLAPVADVRDETVARFAAGRFRKTFRSLRPLLDDDQIEASLWTEAAPEVGQRPQTRGDLDDDGHAFALGLVENWVSDPSNVRLLRIGLDLWPDPVVLRRVLELLGQYTSVGGRRKAPRRVAWYCLADLFRAGATETGFVDDPECLPSGPDVEAYRALLVAEAKRVVVLPSESVPWYLRQQAYLYLAAQAPGEVSLSRTGSNTDTKEYRQLLRYLQGQNLSLTDKEFGAVAVLARRCFLDRPRSVLLTSAGLTSRRLDSIADRDPAFAIELTTNLRSGAGVELSRRHVVDLCFDAETSGSKGSLAAVAQAEPSALRTEPALLSLVAALLQGWHDKLDDFVVCPTDVFLSGPAGEVSSVTITPTRRSEASIYSPPSWCPTSDRWRLQIGYLVRFVLSGNRDYTRPVRSPSWREQKRTYRSADGHWLRRRYAFFSNHSAFGDDALPISEWFEDLLVALLAWPGSRVPPVAETVRAGREALLKEVRRRLGRLLRLKGQSSGLLMLPLAARWAAGTSPRRNLRVAIVQTVIPNADDFQAGDLTLSDAVFRRRHRNHLSAAVAALVRLLHLRETHRGGDGKVDLVVFPELAVHPADIGTHLEPFVRAHRSIVLAGLTYQEHILGEPLVNSAIWLIPVWSRQKGWEILQRRQGKGHLAPLEEKFNEGGSLVQAYRPCQWLVDYEWDRTGTSRPLRLSASVCYDATDLRLVADLRDRSDVFIVPALNKDVTTFDQMAQALHYHMYQHVIVANNGSFGGSNAYAPFTQPYKRQIVHLHGQPQATIAFLEIDPSTVGTGLTKVEGEMDFVATDGEWKSPPAGLSRKR